MHVQHRLRLVTATEFVSSVYTIADRCLLATVGHAYTTVHRYQSQLTAYKQWMD